MVKEAPIAPSGELPDPSPALKSPSFLPNLEMRGGGSGRSSTAPETIKYAEEQLYPGVDFSGRGSPDQSIGRPKRGKKGKEPKDESWSKSWDCGCVQTMDKEGNLHTSMCGTDNCQREGH